MADDKTRNSGGFDDWLDESPGPATDPYASLANEDAEEEIADWVAFTQGDEANTPVPGAMNDQDENKKESDARVPEPGEGVTQEVDDSDETDTGELEVVIDATGSEDTNIVAAQGAAADETAEIDIVPDSRSYVEPAGAVPEPEVSVADTGELDVTDLHPSNDAEHLEGSTSESDIFDIDSSDDDPTDDTGELEVIPIAPYGGFGEADTTNDLDGPWGTSGADTQTEEVPLALPEEAPELFDITQQDYLANATREHSDLAEAIAIAEEQDTAQVAVASSIPGLSETVVGFEDVVEAEGLGTAKARRSSDLISRVITAVVLVLALGASLVWQPALVAFAIAVFVIGAGEFYTSLVRSDRKPIALFGFIGIIGASLGAFLWGALAIPVAFFIAATLLLLFYAVAPGRTDPMGNLALTISVMVWVGLGSFAMLIADSDSYRPLVLGVVITVAAMDIVQYFAGRALGRTPLAPWVSPKKTVEGLVAGVVVALGIGAALHFVEPFELTSGLALGLSVALLAPIGDLAMSAAKRSLGLKDMGSVLPGHGGFLDRIDGLLFVIPAAWIIFLWAGIL
ncbi:MAG: phosphatidate cytidylyltransferase [Actinomycetia bacterium]|nr:phosphatidate cytidylyltransferase [Actinomycetes bacterium]